MRPDNASVTEDLSTYQWGDASWMNERAQTDMKVMPFSVYQIHAGTWMLPSEGEGQFLISVSSEPGTTRAQPL